MVGNKHAISYVFQCKLVALKDDKFSILFWHINQERPRERSVKKKECLWINGSLSHFLLIDRFY